MLTLPIRIAFAEHIDSMKADLTKYCPEIKSSHRVEALARALGFKTYAALRARDLLFSPIDTEVDWPAYRDYLTDKGFNPTAKPLYLAAGRANIRLLLEMKGLEPNLTRQGIGVDTLHHQGETSQQYAKRFGQARMDLLLDSSVEEVLRAYTVVSRIPFTRTITTKHGAYKLKHIAEKASFTYPDGQVSPAKYVPTGSLICAALTAGFWYKSYPDSQNVHFNMLQKAIENLDFEIRPGEGKERKAIAVKGVTPLHYTKRTVETFVAGDKAWISWGGKKALPVTVTEVDDGYYSVQIEHPKKDAGNIHSLRLDEVRSTPELACLNCVTL
ncbi:MAG: hypothetical protein DI628_03545 [Blastochloris viridis]|uniref:Uncharacterized protein n=1 Tax=Blastochloris viridis TaxID=1079 RepID=A0A6N4R9L6_BLAVI|nr:MAG: hypothetical protein DI628_03545 [Blastochloris viridis]